MPIEQIESDRQIEDCYEVMRQLRPHIEREQFVERVRSQVKQGYRMACLRDESQVVAVAGYRFGLNLAWGRYLYVDDLVSDAESRSTGYGGDLLHWLIEQARAAQCDELHLDSGVQRFDAHRFYLKHRMEIRSHHFTIGLTG